MGKPIKYTKVKVVKITDMQDNTLKKIGGYNVNVSQFIRDAISDKIKKDYDSLTRKIEVSECPF